MDESNNIFKYGIDRSVVMGLYTTVISLSMIYADLVPPLAVVAMVLLLAGPVVLYNMQRRLRLTADADLNMWDLWRMGVVAIFFGTVFTLMFTYGVLEYLRPGYMYQQLEMMVNTYKQMPELKDTQTVEALQMMLDEDIVPSPFSYALNMFVMTNTSGMFMGMLTASLAARR